MSTIPQAQFIHELILQELSSAERSVLEMMLGGGQNIQSKTKTIANQKTGIFKKLGLKNTNELIHVMRKW